MAEVLAVKVSELVGELEREIGTVNPGQCLAILGPLEQLKALAYSRILLPAVGRVKAQTEPVREHYLTVPEAAERFRVTPKWLYKHKKELPHIQPSRKHLLFPEEPFTRAMAARKRP
jgi:hypothetical protein